MFPENFIWGTATAAHQIEGNNKNTDWWEWENRVRGLNDEYPLEPSGKGCDSYNRYEEDFDLCVKLNNNAVRFSIEWARIEPKENEFSEKEIEHYKKVLKAAKKRGLKTFVTLHHFTNPLWLSVQGGWVNPSVSTKFAIYAKKCAEEFGDLIDAFLTINEPQVYALQSYTNGTWPPNKINLFLSLAVQINMMRAHRAAYSAIKSVKSSYKVGIVKNIVWYETLTKTPLIRHLDVLYVLFLRCLGCHFFLQGLWKKFDLIGVNYYFTNRITHLKTKNPNDRVSDLGWWIHPVGLENVLLSLRRYGVPIYVTENGLADSKDNLRKEFISDMLNSCLKAIEGGVNLKGYFHWSLLDNYEWHHGYWPRFGLVEIDRDNDFKRIPRDSFFYYADICKTNIIKKHLK